ncbi:MAG: NADH:flavin oxidoreductase [SAR324 cluster bacterium]|nr:NADH:flavin oxidoreductase [SAR324 cluster bacterium]
MFEPFELLNLNFKNCILAPPQSENQANTNGKVNAHMIREYREHATQGVGTIIIESAYVTKQGRSHVTQLGISDEEHLEGLQKLIRAIKREEVVVGIRLAHAGAKTSDEICGEQPIAPSSINMGKDYSTSREFDKGDCEEINMFFIHAAERAEEVGADFIEINGAQQLLFDQCLSSRYNTRDDEYGFQSIESRLKLSLEVIESIRGRISENMPISYYFSIHDKLDEEVGFEAEDLKIMIELLTESGVDIFHPTTIHAMNKFFETDETFIEWVAKFTDRVIVAEGNIKSPQVFKEVYGIGKAQLYVLDKTLFSRPQWYQFLNRKLISQ